MRHLGFLLKENKDKRQRFSLGSALVLDEMTIAALSYLLAHLLAFPPVVVRRKLFKTPFADIQQRRLLRVWRAVLPNLSRLSLVLSLSVTKAASL